MNHLQTTDQTLPAGEASQEEQEEFIMRPKVDFCFRELMTDDELRRDFIAALLDLSPEAIETQLLPAHLRKEHRDDKLGILDVRVLLNHTDQIDIEIQIASFMLWAERSLFYLCKMYTEQIKEGEPYSVLNKCIHVGILDFELFKGQKEYYSRFHLWEDERRLRYTDKLEIHILELPKLAACEQPESELLNWARFIDAEKKEAFEMIAEKSPVLQKAYDKLVHISADEQKRLEYEDRLKAIRDYNTQMQSSWEEGHSQSWEDGEKYGEQKEKKRARAQIIGYIRNLMDSTGSNAKQVMDAMKLSEEEQADFMKDLI